MTTTSVTDQITELMLGGYSIDFACEKGVTGGWTRDDVLKVVRAHDWNLDTSGRIPFRERPRQPRAAARQQRRRTDRPIPAVGPVPVPPLPAALEAVASWAGAALVEEARASTALDGETQVIGGAYTAAQPRRQGHGPFAAAAAAIAQTESAQTPTEGTAPATPDVEAAGTAPDPSGPGHGYAGPDAQPQVSPSRSHSGEGGGPGASDAPAAPPAAGVEVHADRPLTDRELELLAPVVHPDDWVWNPDTKSYESRVDEDEESCRVCGCTEREACAFGCAWAAPGLCTSCVDVAPPAPAPIDVLAVGLAHTDPTVRAKAQRVERAVNQLVAAVARAGGSRG